MSISVRTDRHGDRRYLVRVELTDALSGVRKRQTIGTFRSRRDAEAAERRALVDRDKGVLLARDDATVGTILDEWLATKAGAISANSHRDYEIAIRRHLKPALGAVRAQRLTPADVQAVYAQWQAAAMSARMIHRCHIVLSQAFAQAVRMGRLLRNPAADVERPRIERGKPAVWTPAQVRAFLAAAEGDSLAPLWHLLALEGMRRGEALGLRWADLNVERGAAHISQTVAPDKSNRGAAIVQNRTKTAAGARTVKLTGETLAALDAHRDRQRFRRQAAGEAWQDHDLIVCTSLGTPVNPGNVIRSYDRIVRAAGLPRIRVHDLRHTAATLLLRAGVPAKVVSERLGHAGIAVTMDLYSHVVGDMQDVAAAAMSALLASDPAASSG